MMKKDKFINLMDKYCRKSKKAEVFCHKCYEMFGSSFIDSLDVMTYDGLLIEAIEDALEDKYGWVEYFVFECEMNFDTFNTNVHFDGGKNPSLECFGDLYDFIIGENKDV